MASFANTSSNFVETAEELDLPRLADTDVSNSPSRSYAGQSDRGEVYRRASPSAPALKGKALAVIGTGYVGLVTGACLAQLGHRVTCIDTDAAKVATLANGGMTIHEPGLADIVAANMADGRMGFSTDPAMGVADADAIFVAVGTPPSETGEADLRQVFAAVSGLRLSVDRFVLVVIKSTVPPGTCEDVEAALRANNPRADFEVVSSPEFLREGSAVGDFFEPGRIVVGTASARARRLVVDLYRPLRLPHAAFFFTDRRTAELVKYASNAFLAVKIAFINEMADICEGVGADVEQLAKGVGLDPRIGKTFLKAGPGFGGSCLPKDTSALAAVAQAAGQPSQLVDATIRSNQQRKTKMVEKIIAACGGSVDGKIVAVLGLTFKASTGDLREAPSLVILPHLRRAGAVIHAYDPKGMAEAARLLPDVHYASSALSAVIGADAVIVLTEWPEFADLDLGAIRRRMRGRALIDLRNIYRPTDVDRSGLILTSVGRPKAA